MAGLFDFSEVPVRALLQIIGMPQCPECNRETEQQAKREHPKQALGGTAPGVGKLSLAILKALLVGCRKVEQDSVQLTAPRHDLLLQKLPLSLIGLAEHFCRNRVGNNPEFAEALAELEHRLALIGGFGKVFESPFVFLFERFQLGVESRSLYGVIADKEIPHVNAGLPKVAPYGDDGFLLIHIMPVNLKLLSGDTDLNVIGFDGRQHENGYHGGITGS